MTKEKWNFSFDYFSALSTLFILQQKKNGNDDTNNIHNFLLDVIKFLHPAQTTMNRYQLRKITYKIAVFFLLKICWKPVWRKQFWLVKWMQRFRIKEIDKVTNINIQWKACFDHFWLDLTFFFGRWQQMMPRMLETFSTSIDNMH